MAPQARVLDQKHRPHLLTTFLRDASADYSGLPFDGSAITLMANSWTFRNQNKLKGFGWRYHSSSKGNPMPNHYTFNNLTRVEEAHKDALALLHAGNQEGGKNKHFGLARYYTARHQNMRIREEQEEETKAAAEWAAALAARTASREAADEAAALAARAQADEASSKSATECSEAEPRPPAAQPRAPASAAMPHSTGQEGGETAGAQRGHQLLPRVSRF